MLERELEALSERVRHLERRHRRLRLMGAALVVGTAAVALAGQPATEERTVVAERFVLVDSASKTRAGLRVARDGAVSLTLLDAQENTRAVLTASKAQVRRPIHRGAIQRWRRYERHLGPLFEALGPYAPQVAQPPSVGQIV